MTKKTSGNARALRRYAAKTHTRTLAKAAAKHFGPERGRRVAVGLRAWAKGVSIKTLAKSGRRSK